MMIIGCDYHSSWQPICWLDTATGETGEKKLDHASGEATKFYQQIPSPALIGMEPTGNYQWFVKWLRPWDTMCGSETQQRFGPARCGSRSTTDAMPR